jgi:Protein of unknown function (DUF4238)
MRRQHGQAKFSALNVVRKLLELHMATHVEQHYVPKFLLKQWHVPPDNKLTSFWWTNGQLISSRNNARSVAKKRHLYSMSRLRQQPNVSVEQDFLGPHIDEPAALVHAKLLRSGLSGLSLEDKMAWSPFLVLLMLRHPDGMRRIRTLGSAALSAEIDKNPEEYLNLRGNEPEETLREWVEVHMPDVHDDLGVIALPSIASSQQLNLPILNATWVIRTVPASRFDLLISDRPFISEGTFETSFLVALPISPRKLFFAFNNINTFENLKQLNDEDLVKSVNRSTVDAAEQYVYATSIQQKPFISKFLRKP